MIVQRRRYYFPQVTILFSVLSGVATAGWLGLASQEAQAQVAKTKLDLETEGGAPDAASIVAFSPDNKTLVAGGGWLRMWNVASGQWTRSIGLTERVRALAWSPDGRTLATNGWDLKSKYNGVQLRHTPFLADENKLETLKDLEDFAGSISFSDDGLSLAAATSEADSIGKIWRLSDKKVLKTFKQNALYIFQGARFFKNNQRLIGFSDWDISSWDIPNNKAAGFYKRPESDSEHGSDENENVSVLAISPDETTLAAADLLGVVRLWDLSTTRLVGVIRGHNAAVLALSFSPDGKWLASGDKNEEVRLWNLRSREEPTLISQMQSRRYGGDYGVASIAWSPDGKLLADGSVSGRLTLWNMNDIAKPQLARTVMKHLPVPKAIEYSNDGKILWVGSEDNAIKAFSTITGGLLFNLTAHSDVISCITSSKGGLLWSGSYDGTVKTWNIKTKKMLRTTAKFAQVSSLALSPDEKSIATGYNNGFVRVWNTATGKLLYSLKEDIYDRSGLAFSCDNTILAVAVQGRVAFYNAKNGKILRYLSSGSYDTRSMTFARDNQTLFTSNGSYLRSWNVRNGKFQKEALVAEQINTLRLSNDGKTIFVGSEDSTRIFDIKTFKIIRTFDEENGSVISLASAPQGDYLAAASRDGKVDIYALQNKAKTAFATLSMLAPDDEYSTGQSWLVTDSSSQLRFDASHDITSFLRLRDGNVVLPFSNQVERFRVSNLLPTLRKKK